MSGFPTIKHGPTNLESEKQRLRQKIEVLNNSSDECLLACSDLKVLELSELCRELRNTLADLNEEDSAAEIHNNSSFKHRRKEIDDLTTRAGKFLNKL